MSIVPFAFPAPRRAVIVAAIGLLAACGGGGDAPAVGDSAAPRPLDDRAPDSAAVTAAAPASPLQPAEGACPMQGLWRRCSVVERLERSGFAVAPLPDTVRQPGIAIAGSVLRLGRSELQLFLYADTADARREAAAVRAADARPADARGILRPPAVIHSLNLVALFFNNDDHQLERVQLALTAGLPAG